MSEINETDNIEEKQGISFSVQMTWKEIFKFTMYHTYHSFAGVIGVVLSVIALIDLIVCFNSLFDQGKTILTIVAAWFIVFEPIRMLLRSRSQMKLVKAYKKPLDYIVSKEGITVSQDDQSQQIEWSLLIKIIETKSQYLVYSSRVNAFIFPKNCVGEMSDELGNKMAEYSKDTRIKLLGGMKKRRA